MHRVQKFLCLPLGYALVFFFVCSSALGGGSESLPTSPRAETVIAMMTPGLQRELATEGLQLGNPIFIRIFKVSRILELWMKNKDSYQLFKRYPICNYSGYPGPKREEGDWQSPEGFYEVTSSGMNPASDYDLAFNIGYPNLYDQARNHTGSAIMVHGGCSSIGCYAMSDFRIEEIYTLAHAALSGGQSSFSVHIFPFRMTEHNLRRYRHSPWFTFWESLRKGYDAFERNRQVPEIAVVNGDYVVNDPVRIALSGTPNKEN
jgi:murein L,D-transpeptidase YafK